MSNIDEGRERFRAAMKRGKQPRPYRPTPPRATAGQNPLDILRDFGPFTALEYGAVTGFVGKHVYMSLAAEMRAGHITPFPGTRRYVVTTPKKQPLRRVLVSVCKAVNYQGREEWHAAPVGYGAVIQVETFGEMLDAIRARVGNNVLLSLTEFAGPSKPPARQRMTEYERSMQFRP